MMAYNLKTGVWKTIKNTAIVWGVPALLLLVDNWTQWVPAQYAVPFSGVVGFISYFVKNFIENK